MKHFHIHRTLCVLAAAALVAPALRAGDWPGWRGPTGVGISDEKDLPLTWDAKKKENILWSVTIGGHSYSSPIVWGDRVFVTTSTTKGDKEQVPETAVVCYRANDGMELWRTPVPPGSWPKEKPGNNIASPTPATDGERVYAWFGNDKIGVLAAVDFDGKVAWRFERLGPFALNPALCSSPVLYKDTVIQLCDQGGGKGFLVALDKKTGDVKWEQKRDKASHNNCTPVILDVRGKPQLVLNASNGLQGLDPDKGELLWWATGAVGFGTSPAYGSGLVYAENGNGGSPGLCVDPTGSGDVTKTHVKWQVAKAPGAYASPVIAGDYVFKAHKENMLTCWSLATGEVVYSEKLEGLTSLSSPFVTADGLVYFASAARTYVIRPGPKLDVAAKNDAGHGDDGPSAAVSGGRIFLKSTGQLICIGKK